MAKAPTVTTHGATTAIQRRVPPEPLRWLHNKGLIIGRSLDYGSGRQCWYGMHCYDPHWRPVRPTGQFDTIVCSYVLNVVPLSVQKDILARIRRLLKPGGAAYIAVRRDLPRSGQVGRGTYQRYVVLRSPSVRKTAGYEIYKIRKIKLRG